MDLTPVIPVFVALLTFGATVGGIAIKAGLDGRAEKAKVLREDAHAKEQATLAARERVAERARAIADLFLDELQGVRKFTDIEAATGFPIWYEKRWRTSGDIPFRRAIAKVDDADERTQLVQILDSIDDFQSLAQWKYFHGGDQRWVEDTLTLGFDLASTMARGQEADYGFTARYEDFRTFVMDYYEYQEEQRQAESDARKAEAQSQARKNETEKAAIAAGWAADAAAKE